MTREPAFCDEQGAAVEPEGASWPTLDESGQCALAPGETVVSRTAVDIRGRVYPKDQDAPPWGWELKHADLTLTDRRIMWRYGAGALIVGKGQIRHAWPRTVATITGPPLMPSLVNVVCLTDAERTLEVLLKLKRKAATQLFASWAREIATSRLRDPDVSTDARARLDPIRRDPVQAAAAGSGNSVQFPWCDRVPDTISGPKPA